MKMRELINSGVIGAVKMGFGLDNVSVGGDYYYQQFVQ
jgi:hypothetical protein